MPKIDDVLYKILEELSVNGQSSLDERHAEKLFNLRLIDYEIGYKWKVNTKGLQHLETNNK